MGSGPNPVPTSLTTDSDNDDSPASDNSLSKSISVDKMTPQVYDGHLNQETVKGVGFFGPNSDYVTSGSDCGSMFIWKKKGGELIRAIEGDKYVVNCIESHPHSIVLASSGIDSDVKIWHPEAIEKVSLHDISSRPKRRRPMHFFDVYTGEEEDYEDDDDNDDGDGNKDDSDDSMDEYDDDEEEDDDSEDDYDYEEEFNYEAYESCDSGESDHDTAIDDDPATGSAPSDG